MGDEIHTIANKTASLASQCLGDLLEKRGSLIYSAYDTLCPGDMYLIGLNPGGDPKNSTGKSLRANIEDMANKEGNEYLDGKWENGKKAYCAGKAPLQERVKYLLTALGEDPQYVFASNLIFIQSKDASTLTEDDAEKCWHIHEYFLGIVQPKVILAYGNSTSTFSPYSYMLKKFGGIKIPDESSGHGNWKLRGFRATIHGNPVFVAGLPHLSRYSPVGRKHVICWIKKNIENLKTSKSDCQTSVE